VELMNRDVDFQLRETVDSALAFGRATLEGLGVAPDAAAAVAEDVRKRDVARLVLQQAGALPDAANWMRGISQIKPEPLTEPRRPSRALNAETRDIIGTRAREAATHTLEARDLPADA
jgi:CPA2 family monovalent cation:H+ antiporter-2/glutathione-regulated potassium-efflux system protein KefB